MAAVRIVIPTALRQYAANHDAVDVEAESVEQALGDLVDRFDQLRRHLYADTGRLRNFVNVYVNEEDIRYLEKDRSEEHTSELQSPCNLVCRLLLEKKKKKKTTILI